LQAFDYVRAQSVDEVVSLLSQNGDQARILSGGTDLIVAIREGRRSAKVVIDVKGLPETSQIEYSAQSGLKFGASVPCYRLYQNKEVATAYAGLMDSAHLIGGTQIQGRASIGGNLCNASPAADSIPTLIAYSTICVIAGPNGVRELPVEEFCIAPGRNALQNGEFLLSLKLPPVKAGSGASYLRFIPRNEMDIAVVGSRGVCRVG
jgi:xanthine dehydrogenase FAD-binding subunit